MLTRLGKPAASADAVDLLLECHERIRAFLTLARRMGEAHVTEPQLIADAAVRVRRYFTEALPLHAQDEEESILPRLHGREPRVDAALEAMVQEHREHEPPLRALVEACEVLAHDPGRHEELTTAIEEATDELERHFAGHLGREEGVIFPAMRRLLDRDSDAEIVRELRVRRGAVQVPGTARQQGGD